MLIKTKYIDCASKSVFNTWKLPTSAADTSGDIYWSAVVYIKDTGEVWTHGKLYGGFFSNADNNKVSLTIGGTTKILALDGHVQSYTTLTGSGSIADQAILSTGEANKWTLKTLGKNAFSNVDYLPADATAVAAEKVVHALAFQYNGKAIHSFDGSVARVLNIIQGDNVFITGDSQGNVTIAADPGSDTVNTAGATNKVDTKLFLIGAESQTTAPQTYSNQYVYIGTDNCLYSLGKKVLTEHQAIYNLDLQTQVGEAVTKVTTFDPNAANNSFTLVQGTNVTLTPDAANKKVTISSKDTTYDFYNLVFKQGESVIDTYKPTTSPSKTLKAGTNVTFTGSNNEVLITTQDTRNTAGATEKLTTKLFLTGALTQTDNPQTYTNSKVYIGADNKLYSDGKVVSTGDHTHNYAGATSPGGPALKVDLNPSGLLDATYGSYGGILQDSNKGPVSGSWSNRIKILHNNSTGYYTELAQNFTGTAGLWHRRNVAGTVSEWTPVIDNANFHTYLDSTYVIRGNDPNVLTNYVRYSIASGLTMNWEWGNATPTHIWGAKASDSSKAYVFNGDNIRAFANAVNRAGDTMTGPLVIASTVNNQYNEGLRISLAANNWAGITFGSTGTSGAPSNGWFAARNPSNQFIISPGDSSSSTGLTLNKGGNLLWRNRNVLLKDEINSQVGGSKSAQMNWASWGTDNYGGAIQIREKGLVTNTQSAWGYSPALSFHWGNRYAKRFGMRYDGQFAVDDVPISLSTHNHNSLYVTALGTNGNYLTWTKNGTTNNITVPYSTNSDNSDKLDGLQGGRNGGYVLSKTLGTIPDYGYAVVGLINLTNPSSNPSQQNLSIGEFGVYRPNAVGGFNNTVTFAIQRQYNSTSMVGTYYWVGSADYMKPVTFTYGGVKYGGFAVRLQAANGVIRMQLRYGDIEPFMVTYKTVNNGTTVNNSEINNSLVEVSTLDNKINAVVSKLGTATIGSATLPVYLNSGTITQCTASSIFSNLSNSGNNISITIAGQNRTLTPAYATSAGTASNSNALGGYSLGTSSTSGTWNKVPLVRSDGVIEIGRYIDMHYTNTSTKDYGTRIQISSDAGNALTLPTSSGTLCLTNHSHSEYYSSNISCSANTVLAAPNGSSGSATFRKLVAADIPTLDYMSKKGSYSQPIVLAAGYVYRSNGSSSSWYFSGSKVSAISSVSCSVSGGVMTITFNPSSGHSIYCYAACANMATSGDMPSYTGNYSGRSGGAEWMGTYCSGGSSIWMRQMAQSNTNNDSWHSDNMNKGNGPTRITLIVCGYHS